MYDFNCTLPIIFYSCDERIQKIQTIKMMEGIFICAAPHCLKSFLKKSDFELHINEAHSDLIRPNKEKEGYESEAMSASKPSASDSTVQAPPRPVFSPHSSSQLHDSEDKAQLPQSREKPPSRPAVQQRPAPPFPRQTPDHPSDHPDRGTSQNHFPQHTFEAHVQGSGQQDSGQFLKIYPNFISPSTCNSQPSNSAVPVNNPNSGPAPPQYDYPPYAADGTQQYFGGPYGMPRPGSTSEGGPGQGSLLGFPPGPAGPMNFPQDYPQWNAVPGSVPLEPPMVSHRSTDGFMNVDPQGRGFFQNAGNNNSMEQQRQGGNFVDPRNGKGILAPQPPHLPPPPSVPHPHPQRGRSYSGDGNNDGPPGFSWPAERRDNFGSGD